MSDQEKMAQGEPQGREEAFRQALQKASMTIRQLLEENASLKNKEPIAIIGMACRFPGGANNPEQFWQLLQGGIDAVTEVPSNRWTAEDYYAADLQAPGKMYTSRGGFLNTPVDGFDADFFGISPKEARAMDPQHRLLLEIGWEALEHACLVPSTLKNSRTGVYVGMSSDDYARSHRHSGQPENIDAYAITGSTFSTAVGRLSYILGLQGPCMALDTACSSSLVALHLACRSLQSGESDLALAGGVNLMLSPELHICFSKLQAISPDGKCKTFDASANGYARGEGCGMVVLKRLKDAVRDGNRILALVKGSAINQDGKTNGLAAPNGNAQQAVIREALADAGLQPAAVDYVEAHGTGTILGDPIEVEALGAVLGSDRQDPLRLGAVKTNIGHLEPAAGMAGLIKILLSLAHEELPQNIHFQRPNPHIDWDNLPLRVLTEKSAWPRSARPRIAGLSSFGFSGTNAHVIVAEAPQAEPQTGEQQQDVHLLNLSARDEAALQTLIADYLKVLPQDEAESASADLADLCYSAAVGRHHWPWRLSVAGRSPTEMRRKLADFIQQGQENSDLVTGHNEEGAPDIAFLFTGQGSQYPGMGHALYQSQTVFKQAIDRCDAVLQPLLNRSLPDLLFNTEAEVLNRTAYAQPALFALECALYELWSSWGISPSVLMGHSVGEYVAAYAAGVFSLEDGLTLIAERGRLMQALPAGGGMAAVFASESLINSAIAPYQGRISIAAYNGPEQLVISGDEDAVRAVCATLDGEGIQTSVLAVSHAFHSQRMEGMLADFERIARRVVFSPPRIKLISNITGMTIGENIACAEYWLEHIQRPVDFSAGMATLKDAGIRLFVEIGPHATLLGLGRRCLPEGCTWLPSLRQNVPEQQQLSRTLAGLYVQGAAVNWSAVYANQACRWASVPTYPFQRKRFWVETSTPGKTAHKPSSSGLAHPLLDRMIRSPLLESILFETRFGEAELPVLRDHHIFGKTVVSGACLTSMILGAAKQAFGEGTIQLAELMFHQALAIADGAARSVHLAIKPLGDGTASFRLVSLAADSTTTEGTLHASGNLRVLPHSAHQSTHPLSSPSELWHRFDTEIPGQSVYEAHRRRHIELGNSNQWLESVRLGRSEAIGRLRLPRIGEQLLAVDGYLLHPGLIDSCYGLLGSVVALEDDETLVPFAIERFNLVRPAQGQQFWVHIRRRVLEEFPDKLIGDIQLLDEQGELIAECLGLEGRAATPDTLLRTLAKDPGQLFYRLDWINRDRQTALPGPAQNWLIFMDDAGHGSEIAKRLKAQGHSVAAVYPGTCFERLEMQGYRIDPMQAADMLLLLTTVFKQTNYAGIVYLWSLNNHKDDPAALEFTITQSCAPALHLVQALGRIEPAVVPALVLVTQGGQPIDLPETSARSVCVDQAPLWGMGKTIALEHPELRCKCIDLDPDDTDESNADFLVQELLNPTQENQIVRQGSNRLVARLIRYRPEHTQPLPVRQEGHYLICGGLGGLGLLLAKQLVARGARHLTLCGRNTANPEAAAVIAGLEQSGATIRVRLTDITDAEQVQALIATASAEQPLTGIVHAAGMLDDGVLAQFDWPRFRRVLASKTVGLQYLHELSRHLPLDFFIGFSSMASLTGSPAQGAYVAANSFVDALMHQRRAEGLAGLSINWGPWAEVGMAARLDDRQRLRLSSQGINAMSAEDAFRTLDRLWPNPPAQLGIMDIHWPEFLRHFPGATDLPLFESLRQRSDTVASTESEETSQAQWIAQLDKTPVARRRTLLSSLISGEINRVLGAASDRSIAPRQRLFDLGLDSLTAVELKNRLSAALTCPLITTLLFDYPTLEALTNHLSMIVSISFEAVEVNAPATTSTSDDKAAALDQMSQQELEDLLAEKLSLIAE
ncbi:MULTISPECIES: type I polyketide synthase [Methylobacter]